MREIKFRVWDKVTKKMFTGFSLFGEMTLIGGIHAWQHEEAQAIGIKRDTLGALNDLVEMQYTGLKDVKGREIYESDLVAVEGFVQAGVVVIRDGHMSVDIGGELYFLNFSHERGMEVVGNIHEGPK